MKTKQDKDATTLEYKQAQNDVSMSEIIKFLQEQHAKADQKVSAQIAGQMAQSQQAEQDKMDRRMSEFASRISSERNSEAKNSQQK
jgi:hypothetical protein